MNFIKNYNIVVVGSGISTFFFLKGLNKKLYNNTCVLEGNNNNYTEIKSNTKKINFFRSIKFGGLAMNWLGGYSSFQNKDLSLFDKKFKSKILFQHSKFLNIYNKNYNDYLKNKLTKKNFLIDTKNNFLKLNKTLLEKKKILKPHKIENIKYLKYNLVDIKKKNNYFYLKIIRNNQTNYLKCKKVVLASGTIDTAVILSKILKLKKIFFKHQFYINGVSFFPFKKFIYHDYIHPHYSYESKNSKISGTIDYFGKVIKDKIKQIFPNIYKNIILQPILNFFLKRTIFFNSFVNSKYCNVVLKNNKNEFILESQLNNKKIRKFTNLIKKNLKEILKYNINKYFILKLLIKPIGFDKHYYGIFFNMKNKKLKINYKSELANIKNLYICDQSAINVDTSKFITFLSIANSFNIGKNIMNK